MPSDPDDHVMAAEVFDSPEEAALAGWRASPKANPRVIAVEPSEEFGGVWVTVQIDGYSAVVDVDNSFCRQTFAGRWEETSSGGAH